MNVIEAIPSLPADIAQQVGHILISLLPAPRIDTPDDYAVRVEAAIASVAALRPVNAFEALLAVQIVGVNAHAMDCLRIAVQPDQALEETLRSRAQAAGLMRHMRTQMRSLQRIQAAREQADVGIEGTTLVRSVAPGLAPGNGRAGRRSGTVPRLSRPKLRIVH